MEIQERDVDTAACIPVNVMAPLVSAMFVVPDWVATDPDQLRSRQGIILVKRENLL